MSREGEETEIKIFPPDESVYDETRRKKLETFRAKLDSLSGVHPLPEPGPTEAHSVREMRKGRRR